MYDSDFQQSINEEYLALLDTSAGDEIPITIVDEVKEAIQSLKPHAQTELTLSTSFTLALSHANSSLIPSMP